MHVDALEQMRPRSCVLIFQTWRGMWGLELIGEARTMRGGVLREVGSGKETPLGEKESLGSGKETLLGAVADVDLLWCAEI